MAGKRDLVGAAGRGDALLHRRVVGEGGEALERLGVLERALADASSG